MKELSRLEKILCGRVVENKYYVEPGTIYVAPSEILLNFSGELLPVKNLSSDEAGVFVLIEEILAAKPKNDTWICAWCGESNNGGNSCSTCYKMKKESK